MHAGWEKPPCPPRTTAFAGEESLQTATAGGRVAPHLQTDGKEDQALPGTSRTPASPGAVLCKPTATGSAVPDSTSNAVLDETQKPFLGWKRSHGGEAREKLRQRLLNFIHRPAMPTKQPS